MPSTAVFLKAAGALMIVHAAYSCMHYRSLLQDMDLLSDTAAAATASSSSTAAESLSSAESAAATEASIMMIPPIDVYVELALAFGLLLVGELIGMGPLQSVELSGSKRTPLAAPAHRTRDFDIYCNRSRVLMYRATKAE
mmetsp:Transcript_11428/g.32901  ORF Transcript_11428/g.32901 Transcript_11428/m.32901 type:complete len:140 (-) Transcript_11428:514-933(-)|eukprot:CAMPEP_0172368848 /NCGR_PEP_ID=MMETSP1060-20121228/29603_1 /TAXON_ID=37318 /ORGANISM="Pseudo-nitzschia pungens, Strain cf. cingulata" /LENGTH=139 /DNA_ID=CAMNT_0013093585 /DNA_START=84 /DNA_END=503 /DNA_ORIENTATION=+